MPDNERRGIRGTWWESEAESGDGDGEGGGRSSPQSSLICLSLAGKYSSAGWSSSWFLSWGKDKCLAIGLDAFKKCVSLYWLIPFPHFPNTSQPGCFPESVLSEISRDWLITTPEGVGTAVPIRDVLGASLVPGAVLGAGLRQGPLPSLSASLQCVVLSNPPPPTPTHS